MSAWGGPPRPPARRRWSRDGARSWALAAASIAAPLVLLAGWLVANDRNPTLGWFVGVLTIAGLMIATVLRDRSRWTATQAMVTWARSVGWAPMRDGRAPMEQWPGLAAYLEQERRPRPPSVADAWRLPPFGLGPAVVEGLLVGRYCGRLAVTFEYGTAQGAQLRATQVRYHVVAIQLPAALPTVWFAPRWVDAPAVGDGREVLFESAEFNDGWRVTGDDPRFVHAAVTPLVMRRLLQPDAAGLELRIEGGSVVHWRLARPDPESTDRALRVLADVVEALPPFVWQEYGRAGRGQTSP